MRIQRSEEFQKSQSVSHLVMPNSLWPYGLQPTRLLRPWDSLGKNSGVGYHALLQGSSWPRNWTHDSTSVLAGQFFTTNATWKEERKKKKNLTLFQIDYKSLTKM